MCAAPITHNNRTGSSLHEDWLKEMLEGTKEFPPASLKSGKSIIENRAMYAQNDLVIGTYPPLGDPQAFLSATDGKSADAAIDVFMDQMTARLAFERTGVRLYEGMIGKLQTIGEVQGGPSITDLESIQRDEAAHFRLLEDEIARLGGDPTAVTPAADIQATLGKGAIEVIADPRTDLMQALNAVLLIELADNVSWSALTELGRMVGADEIADKFREAHETEQRHLAEVQGWMTAGMQSQVTAQPQGARP